MSTYKKTFISCHHLDKMYLWLIFKYVLFSIFTFMWAQLLTFGVERKKSDLNFKREKWQDDGDRSEEKKTYSLEGWRGTMQQMT